MPTFNDLLGPNPNQGKQSPGTFSDLLGPPPAPSPLSGEYWDHFMTNTAVGRTLSAFGHGAAEGWGTSNLGLSPESEAGLRKAGIFPNVAEGQAGPIRAVNEALIRPAAVALDATLRAGSAAFTAAQGAVAQTGSELGAPILGRDVAAIPEAFFGQPGGIGPHAPRPLDLGEARSLGVVGGTEGSWKGTAPAQANDVRPVAPHEPETPAAPVEAPPIADVHVQARQVAPEVFEKYDPLVERQTQLRQQIATEQERLRAEAQAQLPNAAEISNLEERIAGLTPRMEERYGADLRARLDAAREASADQLALLTRDTPEIQAMREELQRTDYAMRDLSPQVSAAYREAEARMPPAEPEAAPAATEPPPEATTENPPGINSPSAEVPAGGQKTGALNVPGQEPAAESQPAKIVSALDIGADVEKKLLAAGRPADEAQAAGQLIAAHYEARAARFEGQRGTAADLYREDAPDIRAAKVTRAREMAQRKGKELSQSPSGPVAHLTGTELGEPSAPFKDRATAARAALKRMRDLGPIHNPDLGDVRISGSGINKTFSKVWEDKLKLIPALREIIGSGKVVDTAPDYKNTPGVKAYHKIEAVVRVGNRDLIATATIREDTGGHFYYDLESDGGAPGKQYAQGSVQPQKASEKRVEDPASSTGPALTTPSVGEEIGGGGKGVNLRVRELSQTQRGKIRFPEAGRAVITLARDADASTFLHETGHAWLEELLRDAQHELAPAGLRNDAATVRKWLGAADGAPLTTRQHERFARGFEQYMMEGHAPSRALAEVFAKFKAWLTGIYQTLTRLGKPITPDIRDVFDRLLAHQPEERAVVAPDRQGVLPDAPLRPSPEASASVTSDLAALHEADAAHTFAPEAGPVADQVRQEVDHTATTYAPEVTDEFAAGDGSRSGTASGAESASDTAEDAGAGASKSGRAAEPGAVNAGGNRPAQKSAGSPTDPNQRFAHPDDGLIDKAGNIRLDLLNQPGDVLDVIRQVADEAGGKDAFLGARRGVIPDAEVLNLADALGMTPAQLNQRKLGQAFNAEQVIAARKLLIQSATSVRDLMAKAAAGTDADVMAYAEAKARHRMIQEQVAGLTAEAGRALRAFRKLEGEEGVKDLGVFLEQNTGRTLFQLRQEAKLGAALDTPGQVSKFVGDMSKPDAWDMVLEYWINGLISGPATHTTYAVGNALLAMWRAVPESAAAGAIGAARRAVTGSAEGARVGEVGAQLHGITAGIPRGFVAGWEAAKTGQTALLPGERSAQFALQFPALMGRQGAIPGKIGTIVRLPSRGVAMIHSFFRAIGYSQAIAAEAYRTAATERLSGQAFAARVADLTTNPPRDMMDRAVERSTTQTLMGNGGEFTRKVADLSNTRVFGAPLPKFIAPFMRIGANIMHEGLMERSPLGLLSSEIRDNLTGRNGAGARDEQVARIAIGSALGAATIGLAAQGFVTGGGPSDPKEAAAWRATGKQPYSIRVGETWYAVHRLGPIAMVMGLAADLYKFGHAAETLAADKLASMMVGSLSKSILDETWMRGVSEALQAVSDPDRYGAKWARDQMASFVPFSVGMGQIARAADPLAREARTTLDAIKAKVPWLSQTLLPRIDVWGQPVPSREALGVDGLSAIYTSRVNNDPTVLALARLGVWPAMPERKIRGVELTDQQYQAYAGVAGKMAKQRLDALVSTPGFSSLPDGVQAQTMRETIDNARETARALTLMQNPDLIQQAIDQKRQLLTTGKK